MDEIEKILQQYGRDRRQQQEAAERIRHLARRRRGVLSAVAGGVVILFATVLGVQRLTAPGSAEHRVLAWQAVPVPRIEIPLRTVGSAMDKRPYAGQSDIPCRIAAPTSKGGQRGVVTTRGVAAAGHAVVAAAADFETDMSGTPSVELNAERRADTFEQTLQTDCEMPSRVPPRVPLVQPDIVPVVVATDVATEPRVPESDSRFGFIASVGAFAMSQVSPGAAEQISVSELAGITSNEISYTTVVPLGSFSANMGVTYTVLKGERVSSSVGLVVSGQAQRGDVVSLDLVPSSVSGIDGFGWMSNYQLVENVSSRETYNIFCLYAGIPFIVDMKPLGDKSVGWSISLTPAHTVFAPSSLGSARMDVFVPNPWKLTLGVGVTLPRRFPKRVGINANLLSVSRSLSMHEVGVEIGF